MPTFTVTSPEGKRFKVTAPEGATQADVLAYAQREFASRPAASAKADGPQAPPPALSQLPPVSPLPPGLRPGGPPGVGVTPPTENEPASLTDRLLATPAARVLKGGVVDPLLAAAQLGTMGGITGPMAREWAAALEASKERGRQATGSEGADIEEFAGSLFPATALGKGLTTALPRLQALAGKEGVKAALVRSGMGAAQGVGGTLVTPSRSPEGDPSEEMAQKMGLGAGIGAVASAVAPPALQLVGKGVGMVSKAARPFYESGREALLRNYLTTLAPKGLDEIKAALLHAKSFLPGVQPTAGEALADVPRATGLMGYQAALSQGEGLSGDFAERMMLQRQAQQGAIQSFGGTANELTDAAARLKSATDPMRERALAQANMEWGPQAVPPTPSDRLRTAIEIHAPPAVRPSMTALDVAEQQLGQLSRDVTPLKANTITKRIDAILATKGMGDSEVVQKSLRHIEDRIRGTADASGRVDARSLDMIRKEAGNTIRLYAEETKNFDKRLTAGLLDRVQGHIDDAIEAAGGAEWKAYLDKYHKMATVINQMKVGQALEATLTPATGAGQRVEAFAEAVRDPAALLERTLGWGRAEKLSDVLTPSQVEKVENVAADVGRRARFEEKASWTSVPGAKKVGEVVTVPSLLSRPAMAANYILRAAGHDADQKINALGSALMRDPARLATFLDEVPPSQRQQVWKILSESSLTPATVSGTATGREQ